MDAAPSVLTLTFAAAVTDVLVWVAVLIGVIIVGSVIIFRIRQYAQSESGTLGTGFTLHDLRQIHKAGQITDEEFETARAAMIGRVSAELHAGDDKSTKEDIESAPDDAEPGDPTPTG